MNGKTEPVGPGFAVLAPNYTGWLQRGTETQAKMGTEGIWHLALGNLLDELSLMKHHTALPSLPAHQDQQAIVTVAKDGGGDNTNKNSKRLQKTISRNKTGKKTKKH